MLKLMVSTFKVLNIEHFFQKNSKKSKLSFLQKFGLVLGLVRNLLMGGFLGGDLNFFRSKV